MKHTAGPLKTDGNGIVTGGPDYCTSICDTPVIFWYTMGGNREQQIEQIGKARANARHIVDCWNACEGINPKAVLELLEACQTVVEVYNEWTIDDDPSEVLEWFTNATIKCEEAIATSANAEQNREQGGGEND